MASIWTLQLHTVSFPRRFSSNVLEIRTLLGFNCGYLNWNRRKICRKFVLRASNDSASSGADKRVEDEVVIEMERDKAVGFKNRVARLQETIGSLRLQETIGSLPPIIFVKKSHSGTTFAIGICLVATILAIAMRVHAVRKSRSNRPGTVADLVRRGQLRSDRRGISTPLKYDDPFNNPLVKVGESNSTVEMCGKVYRLAPVTLTKEQQAIHQKRRSRAYEWKRPTLFLREGDSVPPDVDPDTVRWIPTNHPFATTASDIDEDLAQNNVYQKHGVPFRIQAEHEALQKKLEALQNEQKFNKLFIDPGAAKEFERPFKSNLRPDEPVEQSPSNNDVGSKPSKSDHAPSSFESNSTSEEMQKP